LKHSRGQTFRKKSLFYQNPDENMMSEVDESKEKGDKGIDQKEL